MKTYYKLVNKNLQSFNLKSGITDTEKYLKEGSVIQYEINKWVLPTIEGSKIFIFDNIENCKSFLSRMVYGARINSRIFECEAKGISKEFIFYNGGIVDNVPTYFLELCKLRRQKKKWTHLLSNTGTAPVGTLYASSIKLTKELSL